MNLEEILPIIKESSRVLSNTTFAVRKNILTSIANHLDSRRSDIINENKKDIDFATNNDLSRALIDRLTITDSVIDSMIKAVIDIRDQQEVIGEVIGGGVQSNGLNIVKVRVPLGVVGIIYESRPNVTIDSAALCIKSGNAAILRGGKEAINSNKILSEIISLSLKENNLNENTIYLIKDQNHDLIKELVGMKGLIDVIIPRGGEKLINFVVEHSKIPVIMHDKGVCHTYIDKSAKKDMAFSISFNAKVQRPSACNAMETLLIHKDIAEEYLPELAIMYRDVDVDLRGCPITEKLIDCRPAIEEDWYTEYHDMILSIKVVEDIDEAIAHINKYGSGHSEAIVTQDYELSEKFLNEVDAAAVYVNASTRFTDGGEFGLGAEIGISTQKLHVRGPMGAKDLTTTKYKIYGNGELRS